MHMLEMEARATSLERAVLSRRKLNCDIFFNKREVPCLQPSHVWSQIESQRGTMPSSREKGFGKGAGECGWELARACKVPQGAALKGATQRVLLEGGDQTFW